MIKSRQIRASGIIHDAPNFSELSGISTTTKILRLDPGLYAFSVRESVGVFSEPLNMALPATHISTLPSNNESAAEIIGSSGDSRSWLGVEGGTVIIKASLTGGHILITSYERDGQQANSREVAVRRIDALAPELNERANAALKPPMRSIAIEALLHVEGTGDCRVPAEGWIGNRGRKLRLEAFSLRPLERFAPSEIEYKAYGPNGRETPWVSGGKLCGTRGRGMPLTGFAVRLAAHQSDRFGIEYQGAFFESGDSGPIRDGSPCMARLADDPLEAMNLCLFECVDP
jgi:hypothetical protein